MALSLPASVATHTGCCLKAARAVWDQVSAAGPGIRSLSTILFIFITFVLLSNIFRLGSSTLQRVLYLDRLLSVNFTSYSLYKKGPRRSSSCAMDLTL